MKSPRVALIQAPAFLVPSPPNSLALLSAHLKRSGITPTILDASLPVCRGLDKSEWRELGGLEGFAELLSSGSERLSSLLDAQARRIAAVEPEIAAFSVLTGTERGSLELARRVKSLMPKTTVVFGGPQCLRETHAFDFIREECVDAVALGEADRSFPEFVLARGPVPGMLVKRGGEVVDSGDAREVEEMDDLPFMDFEGFEMADYPPGILYLNTSRGCVRRCCFCTHIVQHKTYRVMSPERAAAEIREQLRRHPERDFIEFGDSLINGRVDRLATLADLLVDIRVDRAARKLDRDFGWGGMAIIHRTMTPALLQKMRLGGCRTLIYGLESGSQRVVDLMHKNFALEDAETVMADTRKAGIGVGLFLMIGYPGETERDFDLTLEFLRRNAAIIDRVFTSLCDVQKGSELDVRALEFGIEQPIADEARWRTKDGSNTYEVRLERHARLAKRLDEFGISRDLKPSVRALA